MVDQNYEERLVLFFLLTLFDEKVAIKATRRTLRSLSKLDPEIPPSIKEEKLIFFCLKNWKKYSKLARKNAVEAHFSNNLIRPSDLDLSYWRQFSKSAPDEEKLCLLWSQLFHFSDETISKGLNVTLGSVSYRTGNALRKIGELIAPRTANA